MADTFGVCGGIGDNAAALPGRDMYRNGFERRGVQGDGLGLLIKAPHGLGMAMAA